MSGISKRVSGSWVSGDYGIIKTATDTITTLPADLYPNDTTATVGLKGNMFQTGTPTPSNPIQPQECGDLETIGEKAGQYKIPISNGQQTTNIYLGSNQTTRQIKKYTFTGEETVSNCVATTDGQNYCVIFRFDDIGMSDIIDYEKTMANISYPQYVSSHFVNKTDNYDNYKTIYDGQIGANDYGSTGQAKNRYIIFCVSGLTTAAEYSAWLAQQYANGTPVEVYYILETETTGIVNEPLRKIGDYADTVSGITIPTIAGENSFDVLTTLKPSEATVNYKGWHPVSAVHERENGAWT